MEETMTKISDPTHIAYTLFPSLIRLPKHSPYQSRA
jgi:hypothetical protein